MSKYNVLIVEDSPIEMMLLKRFLSEEYNLAEAENGAEALNVLNNGFKADIIISDLVMPCMDGHELLNRLSDNPAFKEIPVLIATGADLIDDELKCLQEGCSDFIRKPYNPALLKLRVENTIDRKEYYKLKQKMIVDTFEKHIDPTVVEFLLDNRNVSGMVPQQRELTVLFADIRDFTSISERLTVNQVFELLTECFTITNSCIKKYSGVLDKYIGDSTMAFWGAPNDCEDGAYLACCAAVEMIENTKALFEKYSVLSGIDVALGIGINKGPAMVGNVGPSDRVDYTAIGDTVNTASRFEGAAPGGCIYISRSVAEASGKRVRVSSLPSQLKLKGKEQVIDVYRIESIEK